MILIRHGQSDFNVIFSETRVDPGIVDPGLTEEGERQAEAAGQALAEHDVRRILASPYSRTLHTAEIIAGHLGLPVVIEPLVRERCFVVCDQGSPRSEISARWPGFEFGELPERWWPEPEETEEE
ncbi:MAG: histidine phosphatase family protein, partial [Kiloniellales bacterium]